MNDAELGDQIKLAVNHFRFDQSLTAVTARRSGRSNRRLFVLVPVAMAIAVLAIFRNPISAPVSVFASWTAIPSVADGRLALASRGLCLSGLPDAASSQLILQDQRGTAAAMLFIAHGEGTSCVVAMDTAGMPLAAAAAGTHLTPGGDRLEVVSLSRSGSGDASLTTVWGRTPPATTKVVFDLADGSTVEGSVKDGYYLAWWPSAIAISDLTATDGAGNRLEELKDPVVGPTP
jgi:hypothetical protein